MEPPEKDDSTSQLRQVFDEVTHFHLLNDVDVRLKSEFNLPLSHFEPMSVIDGFGTCRLRDVANELGITASRTSKLVSRIEAAGLCRRWANPDDRRSSLVELTPGGRKLLEDASTALENELDHHFAGLGAEAVEQLLSTLGRLRAAGHRLDGNDKSQ